MTHLAATNYIGASTINPSRNGAKGSFIAPLIPVANKDAYQKNLDTIFLSVQGNSLCKSLEQLESLKKISANWDGHGADAPNLRCIEEAGVLLRRLFMFNTYHFAQYELNPNIINADSDGNIVLEWWVKTNKLTVYVLPEKIIYIKVKEGGEIEKMEDGVFDLQGFDVDAWYKIFDWLTG